MNCKRFKFAIRSHVRISRDKDVFTEGNVQSWSEEHFVIESRLRRTPNVYVLRDLSGETLQGVFYEEQLQKVRAPDVFPIPVSNLQKNMKDFYVYQPSSNTYFLHENKASRHVTKLVKELTLSTD